MPCPCLNCQQDNHGNEALSLLKLGRDIFDTTTHRQVPFSAVVISLMDDTPESIDPVVVSLCVVLEDETSETQVDGIISKIRHAIMLCLSTDAPTC
jgi:hypothetical protein